MANYLGFEPTETSPFYFISYDTLDKETVTKYVCEMNSRGLPLWYDHGIHMGSKWEQVIAQHVADCEAVILFFSKSIFTKADSYVRKEFNLATDYKKKIIVVHLEPIASEDVPVQYAFWWGNVRDLQGVTAFQCRDVDECVSRLFDELNVKLDLPEGGKKTVPQPTNPATTDAPKAPVAPSALTDKVLAMIETATAPLSAAAIANSLAADLGDVTVVLAKAIDDGAVAVNRTGETALYVSARVYNAANEARDALLDALRTSGRPVSETDLTKMTFGTVTGNAVTEMIRALADREQLIRRGGFCLLPETDADRAVGDMLVEEIEKAGRYMSADELSRLPFCAAATQKAAALLDILAKEGRLVAKTTFDKNPEKASYCSFACAYDTLVAEMNKADAAERFEAIAKSFRKLGDFRDSKTLAEQCEEKAKKNRPEEEYFKKYPLAKRRDEIVNNYKEAKKNFPMTLAGAGLLLLGACIVLAILAIRAGMEEAESFVPLLLGFIGTAAAGAGCTAFAAAGGKWTRLTAARKEYQALRAIPKFKGGK